MHAHIEESGFASCDVSPAHTSASRVYINVCVCVCGTEALFWNGERSDSEEQQTGAGGAVRREVPGTLRSPTSQGGWGRAGTRGEETGCSSSSDAEGVGANNKQQMRGVEVGQTAVRNFKLQHLLFFPYLYLYYYDYNYNYYHCCTFVLLLFANLKMQ